MGAQNLTPERKRSKFMKKTQTYPQSMDWFKTHISMSIDTAKKRYDKLHLKIYISFFLAKLMAKKKSECAKNKN